MAIRGLDGQDGTGGQLDELSEIFVDPWSSCWKFYSYSRARTNVDKNMNIVLKMASFFVSNRNKSFIVRFSKVKIKPISIYLNQKYINDAIVTKRFRFHKLYTKFYTSSIQKTTFTYLNLFYVKLF